MQQIAERLNLSLSGIRHYLDKRGIKRRSISEAVTNVYLTRFNKQPFRLKKQLSNKDRELKVAGVMLYWGEGAKAGNSVKFVNSDPSLIRVFLNFFRNLCGIHEPRLKALIHMYPNQNEDNLKKFWSKITQIPRSRFYKSYLHSGSAGTYKNKSIYGTLALNYSDKRLLSMINFWIDEYKQKLANNDIE